MFHKIIPLSQTYKLAKHLRVSSLQPAMMDTKLSGVSIFENEKKKKKKAVDQDRNDEEKDKLANVQQIEIMLALKANEVNTELN